MKTGGFYCLNCSSTCATCFGPLTNNCESCPLGLFLYTTTQSCVTNCGLSYYPDTSN